MKNFVIKTAVKTFLIILGAAVVGFGIFTFACPQHMASFTEQLGNYTLAVRYAALRYSYTGDTRDLARCLQDAILCGDDGLVEQYGDEFFQKDDRALVMAELSAETGVDHLYFFGSALACARYRGGDFGGALAFASDINGASSFASGNPLMALASELIGAGDGENAPALISALNGLSVADDGQKALLAEVVSALGQIK